MRSSPGGEGIEAEQVATAGLSWRASAALVRAQTPALAVLAIRVASAALAYGLQVLLARLMGQHAYGVFAVVWASTLILGHASLWGVGRSVCRFVPSYRARGETDRARGFLHAGGAFALAGGLATALVGLGLLGLARDVVPGDYVVPLAVALCVVPVFALQDFAEGVARSFHWTTLAIAPPYLLRQAVIMAAVLMAAALGLGVDPAIATAATLLGTLASLAVQILLIAPRLRAVLAFGPRVYELGAWARASLPMAFVELATLGFSFVDVVVLGFLLPPAAVGGYFAATRILQLVGFVAYATSAATAQRFAEAHARGDRAGLRRLILRTGRASAAATLAAGAVLLAAAPWLLASFGAGFESGLPALAILTVGAVAKCAFGPGEDVLTMLGAERICAAISLASLVGAVALMAALVPVAGVAGAALAMAAATAGRGWLLAAAASRCLGLPTHVLARA